RRIRLPKRICRSHAARASSRYQRYTLEHAAMACKSILYIGAHDLWRPDGPGVNEREFVASLEHALRHRVHCLVPRSAVDKDAAGTHFTLSRRRNRRPAGHLAAEASMAAHARMLLRENRFDLIVFRLGPLP